MGLLGDMFKGVRLKDPVPGQAQVVSCNGYHGDGIWQNCLMQLVISGEGVQAVSVEHHELVHRGKWPSSGMTLPATVDRANPQKFKIEWGAVQETRELGAQTAETMVAMMRGESTAPPPGVIVPSDAVHPSQLTEEQWARLRMLGIDPWQLTALRGYGPRFPPRESVDDSDDEVDEQLARLAKLGQLRDAGVLAPEEFEHQKRRILEG